MTFDRCIYEIAARQVLAVLDETDRFDATRDDVEECSEHLSPDCAIAAFRGAGALPRGWKYVVDDTGQLTGIARPACAARYDSVTGRTS